MRRRVAVARNALGGLELGDGELIRQAAIDEAHRRHELVEAGWAVEGERTLAIAQREGLEHAGEPEPVVGVEVREEDRVDVEQPDGAHKLALGALPAVEEDLLSPRRTSTAGSPRRALGTEPPVPAKKTERSMGQP